MDLPKRKPNRLNNYDYASPGYYFITICTKNKEKIFWKSEQLRDRSPELSPDGIVVDRAVNEIRLHYSDVQVDQYVVMPNHIHILLSIADKTDDDRSVSISTIIGQMKRVVSMKLGREIWQKGFHDHIIRSQDDYSKIWTYIDGNAAKWTDDCFYM